MTRTLAIDLQKAAKGTFIPKSKRPNLPVLHHVRVFTHDGYIVLQSVDTRGEEWGLLSAPAGAIVKQDFDTCVPMTPLRDWLNVTAKYKGVPSLSFDPRLQTLTITEEQDGIKTRTLFKCLDAAEFPSHLPLVELLRQ